MHEPQPITSTNDPALVERVKRERTFRFNERNYRHVEVRRLARTNDPSPGVALWGVPSEGSVET